MILKSIHRTIYCTIGLLLLSCVKEEPAPATGTGSGNGGTFIFPSTSMDVVTSFSEDWDNWRIYHGDSTIQLTTSFSEDWDNWDASFQNWSADIYTNFSEDWDNWDVYGNFPESYPFEYKVAIVFVPIIVNVLRQQNIIQ